MSVLSDPPIEQAPTELSAAEIEKHLDEILGDPARYGVFPPNTEMLAVLEEIASHRKSSSRAVHPSSVELIREARAGAMWGYDPCE